MSDKATLTFTRLKNCWPDHDSYICYIKNSAGFGFYSPDFSFGQARYWWEELDPEDQLPTGSSWCYEEEGGAPNECCVLRVSVEGYELDDSTWWCPEEDLHEAFPAE